MPTAPLVSVVMSVYDGGKYLEQAIESILEQSFSDYEFIIINDGSTDGTPGVLARYEKRDARILVHHQENRGLIASLNRGCQIAKGKYIARMDADDISLPNRLRKQVEYMEDHPKIGVLGTQVRIINEIGAPVQDCHEPTAPGLIGWRLLSGNCLAHPSVIMCRDIIERLGFYSTDAIHAEDYDLWARASSITQLANLTDVLLERRVSSRSISARYYHTQEQTVVAVMHRTIARLLNAEVPIQVVGDLRCLTVGPPVSDLQRIKKAAEMVRRLHRAYLRATALSNSEATEIARDAHWKLRTLAAWASKVSLWHGIVMYIHALREYAGSRIAIARSSLQTSIRKAARFVIRTSVRILGTERAGRLDTQYQRLRTGYHNLIDRVHGYSPLAIETQRKLRPNFKIGMAILAHERPEYLEMCLNSLFNTNLHSYDITFLIQDDGSTDPLVRQIIDQGRDSQYRIIRYYTPKGHDSWGAAFNKAVKRLLEIDDFDIIGTCDSDALFHSEWLDQTMKVCLWAKAHHKGHILGPFSSFNSSDYLFHRIMGTYGSPYGNYVVKQRMGALNYFFFKEDLLKVGFFEEHRDDETRMTERLQRLRVRNFCTETSYVEHIGEMSVLNRWRPTPVAKAVYGMNLVKSGWPHTLATMGTLGYLRYVKDSPSSGEGVSSQTPIDIIIMAIEKDMNVLPHAIDGARENLRHPIVSITVIGPHSSRLKALCAKKHCQFVCENSVLPIDKRDIDYVVNGRDRSGWLFQQFLKLASDSVSSQEHYLILDADTILIRPQVFTANDKTVLLHSDEHHQPYFDAYQHLMGRDAPTPLSFVCHHMLFQKRHISALRKQIEQRHEDAAWYNVILNNIDRSQLSSVSEYEIYGQWMLQNHSEEIIREYWFNKMMNRAQLRHLDSLKRRLSQEYRSLSFHKY